MPTDTSSCSYTLAHYRRLLESALEQGYRFSFFGEKITDTEKIIYLRHDIDFCLQEAEKICRIEQELGVRATYFIALGFATYNPFEPAQRRVLDLLITAGHQIGLHVEYGKNFDRELAEGLQILALLTGRETRAFSLHNPTAENVAVIRKNLSTDLQFTYAKPYSEDILYYSDSNQKNPCPCGFLKNQDAAGIQLLIHPLWWQESEKNVPQLISDVIRNRNQQITGWFQTHNRIYSQR